MLSIGKRVSVSEVALIAVKRHQITLDEGQCAQLDKGLISDNKAEDATISNYIWSSNQPIFTVDVVRAGIVCRMVSILQGKVGVSSAALFLMTEILNNNLVPLISSEENAGLELALFLEGKGQCETPTGIFSTSDAFSTAKLTPIKLKNAEFSSFKGYPLINMGLGCLCASSLENLIKVVDCVSALSCEAKGCSGDAFEVSNFELSRQQRGIIQSATNIKLMLEGSKRVGAKDALLVEELCSIPQINGPCIDLINTSCKAMDIELNSCESKVDGMDCSILFNPSPAVLAIKNLISCAELLAEASLKRCRLLDENKVVTGETKTASSSLGKVQELSKILANELLLSLSVFNKIDAATKQAQKPTEQTEKPTEKPDFKGKGEIDVSSLTPAQRAKMEAKQKAKAEKNAAKAAAKEMKKSGAAALAIGSGSAQLRAFLLEQCTTTDSPETVEANEKAILVEKLEELMNPFNLEEGGLASFCSTLLDQLNAGGKRKPKIAKGTRDYGPEQMRIRETVFNTIRRVFKRHGGVEIDTPVFELKEVLTGKYGEDSKLIYDLADQGGEMLSLRYDLTVPFARFLAMNSVGNIKRYHMAKVYRRDQPQVNRGRYREFYQCDFDVAGSYSLMVPDAEVITVATEILSELQVGSFLVKLNHRKLLDAIFDICGVPIEKFRPICSAVDKLDKMSWEDVKKEMVEDKGLAEDAADRIGTFVLNSGKPFDLWNLLTEKQLFGTHENALNAMAELKVLFGYLEAMGSLPMVSFDLSLARGLDYYTGVIYEVVLTEGSAQVGSIAAGGRYDNLVGMFSPAGVQTPCVGVSIGIERVFTIMEKKAADLLQKSTIQVYIASVGPGLIMERMKLAQKLWTVDIATEYSHLENPKLKKQLDECLERGIPYMVVFGQDELDQQVVNVKDMRAHSETKVPIAELAQSLEAKCKEFAAF